MKPDIFMSYSRREVGFVDDLTHKLEKAGFNVWLDYRSLIPGTPWAGQIAKGLDESEIILLVVSQSSIASQYVELEWRRVLHENKRIILAIFEAVDLPPELEKFEWVDFRGSYKTGLKELIGQLENPVQEEHPAPETGFKAPPVVWLAAVLALAAGFFSLFSLYTVLIPWLLVPLAWRIFKRNFNYTQVQTAIWLLPVSVIFGMVLLSETGVINLDPADENIMLISLSILFFIPATSIALSFLLRSNAMQRWGKPEATMPKFSNLYRPNEPKPLPVSFIIDHAPQDQRIARDLSKGLTKYGHSPAADIKSAEAVFVLISRFKTDTEADPEQQVVFPVLVQTTDLAEKLSKVQWIDFRKGIRNLDAIAQLLPQPAKMLAALGVRPTSGTQIVLPGIINAAVIFLTILIVLDISSFFIYILQLLYLDGGLIIPRAPLPFLTYFIFMIFVGGISYAAIKALTERRGWLASIGPFLLAQVGLLGLSWWQGNQGYAISNAYAQFGFTPQDVAMAMVAPLFFVMGGAFVLGIAALFRWNDIRRWFPAKVK